MAAPPPAPPPQNAPRAAPTSNPKARGGSGGPARAPRDGPRRAPPRKVPLGSRCGKERAQRDFSDFGGPPGPGSLRKWRPAKRPSPPNPASDQLRSSPRRRKRRLGAEFGPISRPGTGPEMSQKMSRNGATFGTPHFPISYWIPMGNGEMGGPEVAPFPAPFRAGNGPQTEPRKRAPMGPLPVLPPARPAGKCPAMTPQAPAPDPGPLKKSIPARIFISCIRPTNPAPPAGKLSHVVPRC